MTAGTEDVPMNPSSHADESAPPPPPPEPPLIRDDGKRSKAARRVGSTCRFDHLKLGFGRSCGCGECPPDLSSPPQWGNSVDEMSGESWSSTWNWSSSSSSHPGWGKGSSEDYWGSEEKPTPTPEFPELAGQAYADSHCHLDYLLQNIRHGGAGWNTKTALCRWWEADDWCPFRGTCAWAHGPEEIVPRKPLDDCDVRQFRETHPGEGAGEDGMETTAATGPLMRFVITSCCEVGAIEDTCLLARLSESVLGSALFCTFGCHPHNYRVYGDEMEELLLKAFDECGPWSVAWGECGLDYYKNWDASKDAAERLRMVEVFARQARLAVAKGLPLVVHSRDAEEDTLEVLRSMPRDYKVHVHAFQGSVAFMQEVLEMMPNSIFGISGMLACDYPWGAPVEIARHCPLDRLVLETDAPFLGFEPKAVPWMARTVAKIKGEGLTASRVMAVATATCEKFYNLAAHRDMAASRSRQSLRDVEMGDADAKTATGASSPGTAFGG